MRHKLFNQLFPFISNSEHLKLVKLLPEPFVRIREPPSLPDRTQHLRPRFPCDRRQVHGCHGDAPRNPADAADENTSAFQSRRVDEFEALRDVFGDVIGSCVMTTDFQVPKMVDNFLIAAVQGQYVRDSVPLQQFRVS